MYEQKRAWWWADGNFTLEEFLGMWIIHEAGGDSTIAIHIAQTIAQSLYVGHVEGINDAACTSDICHNGVFNIMAAKANAGGRVFAGAFLSTASTLGKVATYQGFGGGNGSKMGLATQYGSAALHPDRLIWHKNDAPHNWGNTTSGTTGLRLVGIEDGFHGTQVDSIYYMRGNFLIYTPNQAYYWRNRTPSVDVTAINQEP